METPPSSFSVQNFEGQKTTFNASELVESTSSLPSHYGDTRLVLLVRDPRWFFAYWEIHPNRLQEVKDQVGRELIDGGNYLLRVYELSPAAQDGEISTSFFDASIDVTRMKTYTQVPHAGASYIVELGILLSDGRFIALCRSNRITMPRGRVSDQTDSQWMAVRKVTTETEWAKIMEISGANQIGQSSGESSKLSAKLSAQRWEFLKSVYSGSALHLSSPSSPWSGTVLTKPSEETSR